MPRRDSGVAGHHVLSSFCRNGGKIFLIIKIVKSWRQVRRMYEKKLQFPVGEKIHFSGNRWHHVALAVTRNSTLMRTLLHYYLQMRFVTKITTNRKKSEQDDAWSNCQLSVEPFVCQSNMVPSVAIKMNFLAY